MENWVMKRWGQEEILVNIPNRYCAKYLYVLPGFICSEHLHEVKQETFICLGGTGVISVNGELRPFAEGDKQTILPGEWHFFASLEGMTLLEVSTFHSDDDVQRKSESRALTVADHRIFSILGENGNVDAYKE